FLKRLRSVEHDDYSLYDEVSDALKTRFENCAQTKIFDPITSDPEILSDIHAAKLRNAQAILNILGYGAGFENGRLTPETQIALRDFQQANGLSPTGAFDEETERLMRQGGQLVPKDN
ncbi:peptidoglycan-binding domain-containing protein, partial [Marivita sp. S2033]|uniref:peptidoglycan-binding domain-containing protein n=1 Tax=Marivita sp. S2033 TaxID=3373187 RepID=UPI003982AF2C